MPSSEEREQIQRSWNTRMESVIRQFNSLAAEDVTETDSGNLVKVVGLCITHGKTVVTVLPVDVPEPMYSVEVGRLQL